MSTKRTISDDELIAATRHAVSRHQDITSTPRDTMAVLMQEAANAAETNSPIWSLFSLRWTAAVAAVLVIAVCSWFMLRVSPENAGHTFVAEQSADLPTDIGIDIAAWDMEIDALFDELDTSVISLVTDQSDAKTITDGLITGEEPWL